MGAVVAYRDGPEIREDSFGRPAVQLVPALVLEHCVVRFVEVPRRGGQRLHERDVYRLVGEPLRSAEADPHREAVPRSVVRPAARHQRQARHWSSPPPIVPVRAISHRPPSDVSNRRPYPLLSGACEVRVTFVTVTGSTVLRDFQSSWRLSVSADCNARRNSRGYRVRLARLPARAGSLVRLPQLLSMHFPPTLGWNHTWRTGHRRLSKSRRTDMRIPRGRTSCSAPYDLRNPEIRGRVLWELSGSLLS